MCPKTSRSSSKFRFQNSRKLSVQVCSTKTIRYQTHSHACVPITAAVAYHSRHRPRCLSCPCTLSHHIGTTFHLTAMADYIVNSTNLPQALHPFYPLEANIVGYLANRWSVWTLLGIFAGGWVVILGITLALVRSHNPTLPSREKATILWFVLSTCYMIPAPCALQEVADIASP